MTETAEQPQEEKTSLPTSAESETEIPTQDTKQIISQLSLSHVSDMFLKWLPAIAGLTAIFAVAGYVIVNISLGRYTDIQPYTILLNQYISAGLSLFFLYCVFIVPALIFAFDASKIRRAIASSFVALIEAFLIILVLTVIDPKIGTLNSFCGLGLWFIFLVGGLNIYFRDVISSNNSVKRIYGAATISFVLTIIFVFYVLAYTSLPRSLGGGYPARVQFLFEDTSLVQSLNLPMVSDKETDEICLLAELTDGYLIYDPSQGQSIVIKYDLVVAIRDTWESLDCSAPPRNPTAIPTAIATPTP